MQVEGVLKFLPSSITKKKVENLSTRLFILHVLSNRLKSMIVRNFTDAGSYAAVVMSHASYKPDQFR